MTSKTRDRIAWGILLVIIFFSVFRTQQVNDDLTELTSRMAVQQQCTEQFLTKTVDVANQRTQTNPRLNKADIDRVRAEAKLFGFISTVTAKSSAHPNQQPSQAVVNKYTELIKEYFNAIQNYLDVVGRTDETQKQNPYPTAADYHECLNAG